MFPCNNSETGGEHVFTVFPRPVYPKTSGVGDTPHASEYAFGYSDLQDSTLRVSQRMLMRPALQMVTPGIQCRLPCVGGLLDGVVPWQESGLPLVSCGGRRQL